MKFIGKVLKYHGNDGEIFYEDENGQFKNIYFNSIDVLDTDGIIEIQSPVMFKRGKRGHIHFQDQYQAYNVRLLSDFSKEHIFQSCVKSRIDVLFLAVFEQYISTLTIDDACSYFVDKFKFIKVEDKQKIVDKIPGHIFEHPALRQTIAPEHRLRFYAAKVDESDISFNVFYKHYRKILKENPQIETQLRKLFSDLIWSCILAGNQKAWDGVKPEWKILLVYRAVKENKILPVSSETVQGQPLLQSVLVLYSAKLGKTAPDEAFRRAHELLEGYVLAEAYKNSEPLKLSGIIPECIPGVVKYCEARGWKTQNGMRAWCPRQARSCEPTADGKPLTRFQAYDPYWRNQTPRQENLVGARLYPHKDQDWRRWRLLELLEALEFEPDFAKFEEEYQKSNGKISKAAIYTLKMAGWVNRLNEIRDRIRCRHCGSTMRADKEYARFLAVFNTTVFSCPNEGEDHDKNVYISYCWACKRSRNDIRNNIIDRRDNRVQVQGYCLCLKCGSGPKESEQFAQGDLCPKCGERGMQYDNSGQRRCNKCHHIITLPGTLTGPTCRECGQKTFDIGGVKRLRRRCDLNAA